MQIAIIGAGLTGICTAFELARLGAQVTVFERQGSVAEQASFAGTALTWPHLAGLHALPRGHLAWRWQRWRLARRPAPQEASLAALARHSLTHLEALRREFSIDDEATEPAMVLLADKGAPTKLAAAMDTWRAAGSSIDLIDGAMARRVEPGLDPGARLEAAIAVRPGGAANARLMAQALRAQAQRMGVEFRFHTVVSELKPGKLVQVVHAPCAPADVGRPRRDAGDTQPLPEGPRTESFDGAVLCAGIASRSLLKTCGLTLPFAALHEASITLPLRVVEAHPDIGPRGALFDPVRALSITRLGQRLRASAVCAVRPLDSAAPRIDFERLHRGLQAWFPGAGQHQQAQHWQTRRALLPDALPLVGASGLTGLWLHVQTGLGGWGLTSGSAEALARTVMTRKAVSELAGLDASRVA